MVVVNEIPSSDAKRESPVVLMWGYLPGATQQRLPLLSPTAVPFLESGESWKDVCGGGCGFGLAISESGKLITWGSTDDQGQSYLAAGKHEETPKEFSLPTEAPIVKAAAGWAHCATVSDQGHVYTWGWKECVPSGTISRNFIAGVTGEGEAPEKQISVLTEQGHNPIMSPRSPRTKSALSLESHLDNTKSEGEQAKRRRTSPAKPELESSIPIDETFSAPPCLVAMDPGVKVTSVAAGGRHTLALSDVGQVWGWGYGGEGQLGLGSRIKLVASPHLIPCFELSMNGKQRPPINSANPVQKGSGIGSYIKTISCGGRHSAVITDSGTLLTFGWGMYGQCGQGNTDDILKPTAVVSLSGTSIEAVAAGLWHTICVSSDGRVRSFGGNQFGQLGVGTTSADQVETLPRVLDAPILENSMAKAVSCGARHNVLLTDDGKVYCWGWNKYGQLGLGDAIDRSSPAPVPLEGFTPRSTTCGWWHTLLLAEGSA
ncbi:OLC1v1034892C1 [Oldenlandia corymbosa var. corymbosa]|uniref:OLC1v1034892C1 n=1 Tax=Oldenlandia corymbosa var. corymbosa TaxID=529605 RepID=A0AAV1CSZ1_OLDCO|nr:OLC1v1034892C1 [Oldenlandia corymbosa var. corymbosa]